MGPIQKKWLESLRAHPERQGQCYLGIKEPDGNYKACCLGEGGLVAGVVKWHQNGFLVTKNEEESQTALSGEGYKALGLRDGAGGFKESYEEFNSLAKMNDREWTWPEIADYIEANPENVFERYV